MERSSTLPPFETLSLVPASHMLSPDEALPSPVLSHFIIATGLAAAGQSECAIHSRLLYPRFTHVEGNQLLYASKEHWVKVPTAVYVGRVVEACAATSLTRPVLFESSYGSGAYNGKEDPREQAIDVLIDLYSSEQLGAASPRPSLVIFRDNNMHVALARLISRVMDRAADRARGTLKVQGVNPETPESVAVMVTDFVTHYSANFQKLSELAVRAAAKGWNVHFART